MGKYYDPDTDSYIEYDDWKQYDESMVEGIMEDCGCEQESDHSYYALYAIKSRRKRR